MSWLESVKGWFEANGGYGIETPLEPGYGLGRDIPVGAYERTVGLESWFPHVPQAAYDDPIPHDPFRTDLAYPEKDADWWDSLWGGLKTVAGEGVKLYEKYLDRPPDKTALLYQKYPEAEAEKELQDWRLFTQYPRQTSGTRPTPISMGMPSVGGISPTILLIGAALVFFMMQKKGGK